MKHRMIVLVAALATGLATDACQRVQPATKKDTNVVVMLQVHLVRPPPAPESLTSTAAHLMANRHHKAPLRKRT